ncbi:MAG TPA: DoxX family protein [Candidatus Bathyarchaeia archaeon]|nr:DoxX family protein [Candidatus Bathyarchaeia archaeon]
MKKTNIAYWVFTGLLSALMIMGAIPDILMVPDAVTMITEHLGYPAYFLPFIGVAKLLGAIAILIPGFPRIKEWAYAGFTYDLIAAIYSMIAVGDPIGTWSPVLIGFVLIASSYILHHKRRKAAALQLGH